MFKYRSTLWYGLMFSFAVNVIAWLSGFVGAILEEILRDSLFVSIFHWPYRVILWPGFALVNAVETSAAIWLLPFVVACVLFWGLVGLCGAWLVRGKHAI